MKKFLYIIGFLMFASIVAHPLVSPVARGAEGDAVDSSGACEFPWVQCRFNIPDPDWTQTFGTNDPEKAGQDLYKIIYNKTQKNPDKKAIKNVTGKYGVLEGEMAQMLTGSIQPILKRTPSLTHEQAIAKVLEIQRQFDEEKDLQNLIADIDAATQPSEFFANGDVGDSGFDLVNDLGNIENLLFKRNDPIDIGGTYDPGSADNSSGNGGSQKSTGNPPAGNSTPEPTGQSGSPLEGEQPTDDTDTGSDSDSGAGCAAPTPQSNPNVCLADSSLDQALDTFDQNKSTDPNLQETETKGTEPCPTDPSLGGAGSGNNGNGSSGPGNGPSVPGDSSSQEAIGTIAEGLSADLQLTDPTPPQASPANPANWLKTPPCNDIYCLKVNMVSKPVKATYNQVDNCIACHVQKIDEQLKYTINHSLIPAKATGNLLEPGFCKNAVGAQLGQVGMHVYISTKPIITPTNDDIVYGTLNILQEWEQFVNTHRPFKLPTKPGSSTKPRASENITDRATKAALSYAIPEVTSTASVTKEIDRNIAIQQTEQSQAMAVAEVAIASDTAVTFHQLLQREMDQTNKYFEEFRKIFASLSEKDQACTRLKDTKQCK